MTDPAYLDEMERRGDSLLDEESYATKPQQWDVRLGASGTVWVRLAPAAITPQVWEQMAIDDARNLANAILSELEIAQREGDGEW
ncbi:MAG: hypothetical protein ACYS0F_07995 [Planctomycetota bacterium]|jgi:hypothetical protein